MDGRSGDFPEDDEIFRFLRGTSNLDRESLPLLWWKGHAKHLSKIAAVATSFLAVQATSVASVFTFSSSECLIDDERNSVCNETIEICIGVRACEPFFK